MRLCDLLWTVGPAIHRHGFVLSWMNVVGVIAAMSIFTGKITRVPIVGR